jgi:hypothetical protein
MSCLNRFLPGGLAPKWDGLGQEARQHGHPPVRYSTKRVELRSTRFAFIAERIDAVEKLVAARVASLSTRRVERFENSCIGSVRVIPL